MKMIRIIALFSGYVLNKDLQLLLHSSISFSVPVSFILMTLSYVTVVLLFPFNKLFVENIFETVRKC